MDIWDMTFLFSESVSTLVEGWKGSPVHQERPWLRAISPPQHRLRSYLASEQKMPWRFRAGSPVRPMEIGWRGTACSTLRRSAGCASGTDAPTALSGSPRRDRFSICRSLTMALYWPSPIRGASNFTCSLVTTSPSGTLSARSSHPRILTSACLGVVRPRISSLRCRNVFRGSVHIQH